MQSGEILRQAVSEMGVKKIASSLNLSPSLIYRWFEQMDNKESASTSNPLWRLSQIYELTGNLKPLEWLCERADGFFVSNGAIDLSESEYSLTHTQQIVKEFGDLLHAISEGLSEDQVVEANEAERIRKEWEDLKRAAEAFVIAAERRAEV
tara:strand:+ start:78 stop:530 length:453 start_codon:yes stop_codon:yes gene_type:complete